MTDAEKVVKALRAACIEVPRGDDWHQPEGAAGALADFVEAAAPFAAEQVAFDAVHLGSERAKYLSHELTASDGRRLVAALARLAEVLS